jgi:hypothetical protein
MARLKLPEPVFKGSSESLGDLIDTNRREEESRRRLLDDLTLGEFFLNLSSHDRLSRPRVKRALPVRDDREMVDLAGRLIRDAASRYAELHMQWQREAVGHLTSFAAEALARLEWGTLEVPDDLDYVGLQAEGEPDRHLAIKARRLGNFAGCKARYLDLTADSMGDYCLRQAACCGVRVKTAGQCLGEEGEELHLRARDAGDWLMLRSKRCRVEARRVGRLAGLDSCDLEMRVHRAGAELGERARDAVIYVYRDAKSLGLQGSGVVYVRRGHPAWRTSFRVERIP